VLGLGTWTRVRLESRFLWDSDSLLEDLDLDSGVRDSDSKVGASTLSLVNRILLRLQPSISYIVHIMSLFLHAGVSTRP
jgi:hypothetical protein